MKKLLFLTLFLFCISTMFTITLDDVIKAIDEYLSQNKIEIAEITSETSFKIKLLIQEFNDKFFSFDKTEAYNTLNKIEQLLDGSTVKYKEYVFNINAIYYYKAQTIPWIQEKEEAIQEVSDYVLNKVSSKYDQVVILRELLKSIGKGNIDPNQVPNFNELLKLYFVLIDYYVHNDPDKFLQDPYVTYFIIYGSQTAVDKALEPIVEISKNVGSELTDVQKQLILNEVLSKYSDNDLAVEIYYNLTKEK